MSSSSSTRKTIKQCLETLIEDARASWTYAIFWDLSSVDYGLLLRWADGYYREENDNEEIRKNSPVLFASSLQEHGIKVHCELNSAIGGRHTHAECFFSTSKHKYFVSGTSGLGQAINGKSPVWITGDEKLAGSHCERAVVAQAFGFQTLALIPAANGVVELGSIYWITQRYEFDLLEKVKQQLDSADSKGAMVCFRDRAWVSGPSSPGNESESSNSVENDSMVRLRTCDDGIQSNFSFPASKMAFSFGLNSGLNTISRAVKPKIEIKPSSGVGDGKSSFPDKSQCRDIGKKKRGSDFCQSNNSLGKSQYRDIGKRNNLLGKSQCRDIGKRKRGSDFCQSSNSFTTNKLDLNLGLSLTPRSCDDGIQSNFSFPASKMALSLGLNSGLNTIRRAVKPKIEIKPSSGVGDGKSSFPGKSQCRDIGKRKRGSDFCQSNNSFTTNKLDLNLGLTPRSVKPKIELKPSVGSLSLEPRCYGSSESDSDNADISAFIRILRRD